MAYATIMDVQQRNVARPTFTASSNPNVTQVTDYLELGAAEIDGILRERGYDLPIDSSATQALKLLEHYNALAAACAVETAAENDARAEQVCSLWESAKEALLAGRIDLDLPGDEGGELRFSETDPIFVMPDASATADRAPVRDSTRPEGNMRDY